MKRFIPKISILILILVLCVSMGGCSLFKNSSGDINNLPDSNVVSNNVTIVTQNEGDRQIMSRADAVEKVARSAVAIKMKVTVDRQVQEIFGSGVIIDVKNTSRNEFYIVTCHHVIASGGEITVYVPDENMRNVGDSDYDSKYAFTGNINNVKNNKDAVTLVGGDENTDIAVLRLKVNNNVNIVASPVPVSSYKMRLGEDVFSVGNPSGTLPMTVSAGIISYLNRPTYIGEVGHMNLVQIDVPTNHGSSGGGLFNMYGELIGITNGGSDHYNSLNYAIPFDGETGFINIALQLIGTETENNFGFISGRWKLGVNVREYQGVEIAEIVEGSNADNSGLSRGDRIVSFEYNYGGENYKTENIKSVKEFSTAVINSRRHLKLGDVVTLGIRVSAGFVDKVDINLTKQYIFCDTGYYPE